MRPTEPIIGAHPGRAVGAFNAILLEHAEAIVAGAEDAGLQVVVQISQNAVAYHGSLRPFALACLALADAATVPVVVHLDHVEDEALIALMLEEILAEGGHEVVGPAATMEQALALCEDAPPQLALLDITLQGGGNGLEVARALFRRWGVRSIFASSRICEARQARDIALGCIQKPYAVETVLRSMDERGTTIAELWCLEENTRARRLYEFLGWRAEPDRRPAPWPPHPTEMRYTRLIPQSDR